MQAVSSVRAEPWGEEIGCGRRDQARSVLILIHHPSRSWRAVFASARSPALTCVGAKLRGGEADRWLHHAQPARIRPAASLPSIVAMIGDGLPQGARRLTGDRADRATVGDTFR